jgi:two-component system, cell cycle response regulator DivK
MGGGAAFLNDARPKREPIDPAEAWVLVVEDNPANFALIARLLAYVGVAHSEWKTSGWGVVEFAERMARLDLILLDLRIPDEDGYQVLARLRQHPMLTDTRVILVTAHGDKAEMDRAREAGFDGFLAKPLNVREFPDQIRRIFKGEQVWQAETRI